MSYRFHGGAPPEIGCPPSRRSTRAAPEERKASYRRLWSEIMGVARCPCCRAPLVARMGRYGPYFHCRCRTEDAARRPAEGE
jgi:hypothetical protein